MLTKERIFGLIIALLVLVSLSYLVLGKESNYPSFFEPKAPEPQVNVSTSV